MMPSSQKNPAPVQGFFYALKKRWTPHLKTMRLPMVNCSNLLLL